VSELIKKDTLKFVNNISSFLIKSIAIGISVLYLMGPLHKHVYTLLHNISHTFHSFEIKNHVSINNHHSDHSHSTESHTQANKHTKKRELAIEIHDDKYSDHHEHSKKDHAHKLIDFIYSLFDTDSDSDDSQDSLLIKVKIDKHLVYTDSQKQNTSVIEYLKEYWIEKEELQKGYLNSIELPPKSVFS